MNTYKICNIQDLITILHQFFSFQQHFIIYKDSDPLSHKKKVEGPLHYHNNWLYSGWLWFFFKYKLRISAIHRWMVNVRFRTNHNHPLNNQWLWSKVVHQYLFIYLEQFKIYQFCHFIYLYAKCNILHNKSQKKMIHSSMKSYRNCFKPTITICKIEISIQLWFLYS